MRTENLARFTTVRYWADTHGRRTVILGRYSKHTNGYRRQRRKHGRKGWGPRTRQKAGPGGRRLSQGEGQ
jgi:hypothetical protein